MKLYAALRRIREYERGQLSYLKSIVDFDIVVEIGYADEEGEPLTVKRLFLLNIGSRTTVRRHLARLIEAGAVTRQTRKDDHRAAVLTISSSSHERLFDYGLKLAELSKGCALA